MASSSELIRLGSENRAGWLYIRKCGRDAGSDQNRRLQTPVLGGTGVCHTFFKSAAKGPPGLGIGTGVFKTLLKHAVASERPTHVSSSPPTTMHRPLWPPTRCMAHRPCFAWIFMQLYHEMRSAHPQSCPKMTHHPFKLHREAHFPRDLTYIHRMAKNMHYNDRAWGFWLL